MNLRCSTALSIPVMALCAIATPSYADLNGLINGDFEAQRGVYDAGGSYLTHVESWHESDISNSGLEAYAEIVGSRNTPREGDSPNAWPTENQTMWVGMSVTAGGYIYQDIGSYENGMAPIVVDFDAIRRASPYSQTWRTIEVQLWTGGSGSPEDLISLSSLGATKRDFRQFAATDLGTFVNYAPALVHVTLELSPEGATSGDTLWLQFTTVGTGDNSESFLDNIVVSGGVTPPPPTKLMIILR